MRPHHFPPPFASWNFFILQSWLPTLLASLGLGHMRSLGVLSALPWMATALIAVAVGGLADRLTTHNGWSTLRVRRAMQLLACAGSALR